MTVRATEEAIVNALVATETMTGINCNTVYALPHDRMTDILRKYGRLTREQEDSVEVGVRTREHDERPVQKARP